jgi:glycosyltransferase involved in cell wall biosynthesis
MKVWIVDPINYSGMAYYDAGLAGGLARAGVQVTLIGSDRPLVRPDSRNGLRFEPLFAGTGPQHSRWRRGLAYTVSILRVLRRVDSERPNWVLWNYIEVPQLDRFVIGRMRRKGPRVAFIAHETEPWEDDVSRRAVYRWLVEGAADAVIVHGKENAADLRDKWDITADRIIVSEHGDYREWVDPGADQAAARERLSLPSDAPIALFFGSLRKSKGLDGLLEAWTAVRAAVPEAVLVVAGRPYRDTDPSTLARRTDGVVVRAGEIPPDAANDYYAACDLVVIPYDKVSTSGVLRYAYSAGRPVVATGTGELRVHVIDGETGCLVPVGEPAQLSACLVGLLAERDRTTSMRAAALAYAHDEFDWVQIGTRLAESLGRAPKRYE